MRRQPTEENEKKLSVSLQEDTITKEPEGKACSMFLRLGVVGFSKESSGCGKTVSMQSKERPTVKMKLLFKLGTATAFLVQRRASKGCLA